MAINYTFELTKKKKVSLYYCGAFRVKTVKKKKKKRLETNEISFFFEISDVSPEKFRIRKLLTLVKLKG